MADLSIIAKAGITNTDAAKIFRVSRGTVRAWLAGGNSKPAYTLAWALKICGALETACEKGLLPLSNVKRTEKLSVIRRIIKAELESSPY